MKDVNNILRSGSDLGIFSEDFLETEYFVDEPLHFQFSLITKLKGAGSDIFTGTSFNRDRALEKTIFEALERRALSRPSNSFNVSLNELAVRFPFRETPDCNMHINNELFVNCVNAWELKKQGRSKSILPSQMVFVPYSFQGGETLLRQPISTGSALGITLDEALQAGILEVIERDDFVRNYYLNGLAEELDYKYFDYSSLLLKEMFRTRLRPRSFNISKRKGIYTILSLCIDESGYGPAITVGAKTSFDPETALMGSLEECVHVRTWLRGIMYDLDFKYDIKPSEIRNFRERGLFWCKKDMIAKAESRFVRVPMQKTKYMRIIDREREYQYLINTLLSEGHRIFYYAQKEEVTRYWVAKAVLPRMLPLFIDEKSNYLDARKRPHYFL